VDLARNLIGRINVGDSLTRTAAARPGQLAVVDGERRFTYADFNAYVNRLAHGLAGLGNERGAALALASGNSADFLAVYYACAKLGVVCIPINLGWQPDEVAYVLGHSAARGIVVESQLLAAMRDAIAKVPEVLDVIVAPGTAGSATDDDPSSGEPADPRVAEVVVVGLPHPQWGEAVTAFVVTSPGETIDAAELIAALKTQLAGFKVPKAVIFVDQLPKTSTGKIQKNVVRSEHAAHYATWEG
jgi:acyl-CoA synthetase (AMP-forming)/AMP-acid ligase II